MFRWGVRRRVCTWDPAAFSELPPARVFKEATARRRRVPRALDPDEARRLVHALDGHPQRALVLTALCTGLRPGELLALHWEDVDLDAALLTVRRAWKGRDDHRHIGEPKTATSVRTLNLPPAVLDALRVLRDDRDDAERSRRRPEAWSELVFTTTAGTPIDPSNYRRLIKELARAAGIGHLAPYDLRHTAASLLSDAGVPNHELADLLGHTTTRMVEVHYRHRLKKTISVAVAPMQDLVGKQGPDDDDDDTDESSS